MPHIRPVSGISAADSWQTRRPTQTRPRIWAPDESADDARYRRMRRN